MGKTQETYLKVVETSKRKGDRAWARAKQAEKDGETGKVANYYREAKRYYDTSERALESANCFNL